MELDQEELYKLESRYNNQDYDFTEVVELDEFALAVELGIDKEAD